MCSSYCYCFCLNVCPLLQYLQLAVDNRRALTVFSSSVTRAWAGQPIGGGTQGVTCFTVKHRARKCPQVWPPQYFVSHVTVNSKMRVSQPCARCTYVNPLLRGPHCSTRIRSLYKGGAWALSVKQTRSIQRRSLWGYFLPLVRTNLCRLSSQGRPRFRRKPWRAGQFARNVRGIALPLPHSINQFLFIQKIWMVFRAKSRSRQLDWVPEDLYIGSMRHSFYSYTAEKMKANMSQLQRMLVLRYQIYNMKHTKC